MTTREGDNYCIRITAHTAYGASVIGQTDDIYNTFDDLKLFVLERNGYDLFKDMEEDDFSFYAGVNLILDERTADVTFACKLVHKNASDYEMGQDIALNEFIRDNLKK